VSTFPFSEVVKLFRGNRNISATSSFLGGFGLDSLGLEFTQELGLLGIGLEATMSVLRCGIDELNLELFGLPRLGAREKSLADGNWSLASSHDTTLDEEIVFVDATVMGEATDGGDVLVDSISFAHGVVGDTVDGTSSNSVDLFVNLSSGMVTLLTTTGDCPLDSRRMPGTNASDFTETSMSLTVKTGASESLDGAGHTLTAGNTNSVDNFIHVENVTDLDLLLELVVSEVDLVTDGSTVNLDLEDVCLALTEAELTDLGGRKNTHDSAVFLDASHIAMDRVLVLGIELVLLGVLGESLLLGVHPVLVHAPLDGFVKISSPDGGERAEAAGGLNVADKTDNLHRWALDDGARVHNILLDHFLALTSLLVLDDVGHAGLVTNEGGKVARAGGVVAGE